MKKKTLVMIIVASGIVFKILTAHYTITNFDKLSEFYNKHIKPRTAYNQNLEEQMDSTFKDRENKSYLVSP